jgi:hypothetical protein
MSHVPALRHVKNPSGILVNSDPVPVFTDRCVAPLEMNAGTCWGKNTIGPRGRSVEKAPGSDFTFTLHGFVVYVLRLYDEVTNVEYVSLLSHDRYQYDNLILSKQT